MSHFLVSLALSKSRCSLTMKQPGPRSIWGPHKKCASGGRFDISTEPVFPCQGKPFNKPGAITRIRDTRPFNIRSLVGGWGRGSDKMGLQLPSGARRLTGRINTSSRNVSLRRPASVTATASLGRLDLLCTVVPEQKNYRLRVSRLQAEVELLSGLSCGCRSM